MPTYTFECDIAKGGCGCKFEYIIDIKNYDTTKVVCPDCTGHETIVRDYSADRIVSFMDEPKTVGGLADRNAKKFSDDQKKLMEIKHNEYRHK